MRWLSIFLIALSACSLERSGDHNPGLLGESPSPGISSASPSPTDTAIVTTPSPSPIADPSPAVTPVTSPSSPVPSTGPSAKPVASPSATIPTPAPVFSGLDLAPIFKAAKSGEVVTLQAGKSYVLNETIIFTQSHITVNLNGASVAMTPSPGSSADLVIRAPYFEIHNGKITKAAVLFHSYADHTWIHDIQTSDITYGADGKQNGGVFQFYTSDDGHATNTLIENVHVGKVGTVGIYWTSDNFTIRNSQMDGSYGEYDLREEITSSTPRTIPKNGMIDNVTADNRINKFGKSSIGIRQGSCTIQNCKLYSDVRIGQGSATNPTEFNPFYLVKNTTFFTDHSPQLAIDSGATGSIEGSTFYTWADTYSIAVAGQSAAVIKDNIRHVMVPGITLKKFWATNATPPPSVQESGTVIK